MTSWCCGRNELIASAGERLRLVSRRCAGLQEADADCASVDAVPFMWMDSGPSWSDFGRLGSVASRVPKCEAPGAAMLCRLTHFSRYPGQPPTRFRSWSFEQSKFIRIPGADMAI